MKQIARFLGGPLRVFRRIGGKPTSFEMGVFTVTPLSFLAVAISLVLLFTGQWEAEKAGVAAMLGTGALLYLLTCMACALYELEERLMRKLPQESPSKR